MNTKLNYLLKLSVITFVLCFLLVVAGCGGLSKGEAKKVIERYYEQSGERAPLLTFMGAKPVLRDAKIISIKRENNTAQVQAKLTVTYYGFEKQSETKTFTKTFLFTKENKSWEILDFTY